MLSTIIYSSLDFDKHRIELRKDWKGNISNGSSYPSRNQKDSHTSQKPQSVDGIVDKSGLGRSMHPGHNTENCSYT